MDPPRRDHEDFPIFSPPRSAPVLSDSLGQVGPGFGYGSRVRSGLAFVGWLASVLVAVDVEPAAATPSAHLVYTRSPEAMSCPNEADLRNAVSLRFGYDPFFAWARQTVIVQMWRTPGHYASRVQLVDGDGVTRGTRELTSDRDSCSELFGATALAISIALDASMATADASSPPETSAAAVSITAPPLRPPSPPEPEPAAVVAQQGPTDGRDHTQASAATRDRTSAFVGLDLLGSAGTAPSVAAGVSAFAGIRTRLLSAGLEAFADAPATAHAKDGGNVTSTLYGVELVPCASYKIASLCAAAALGSLQAKGSGVTSPNSPQSLLFAASGGRIAIEWPVSQTLSLRLHGDLLADLHRPTLVLDGQKVWPAPLFEGEFGAGALANFP
jgi:hypothetical protein